MSKIYDFEWDQAPMEMLEMGYEVYLNRLFEALTEDEYPKGDATESGHSFCGCDSCCTRETLAYLIPRILDLHEQGYIRKTEAADV